MEEKMLQHINNWAQIYLPKNSKVYLFGSRARGDAHERSDFDLAVSTPNLSHKQWALAVEALQEKKPSLHGIDVIWLNDELDDKILNRIHKEKKLIYEKLTED